MSIEQQIEELRAELSWCDDGAERRQIETELKAAARQWKQKKHAETIARVAGLDAQGDYAVRDLTDPIALEGE